MTDYSLLKKAFDPKIFRKEGHMMIDFLADLLENVQKGVGPVTTHFEPDDLYVQWSNRQFGDSSEFFNTISENFIKVHHPKYIGHQVAAPVPISALASLFDTFLNNGMGIYEMGEGPTVLERRVVEIFCRKLGYQDGDGILTSGGTLANLTALLAARASLKDDAIWSKGTSKKYCILVSDMAHYCVDRAARIIGWGSDGIVKVPVNEDYSMDIDQLSHCYLQATNEGKIVVAVVGSAPCTATGSYDDLDAIAKFCSQHDLWFHIDGAHGGPAIFSEKYKHLMKGAECADSVVIDAHKMMLTPALATALLFKKSSDSYQTFSQKADYLFEAQHDKEWYNIAKRSFECTKVAMSLRIMSIVDQFGLEIFDQFVTRQYDLAREFAKFIQNLEDFELAVYPDANIVCFRYIPDSKISDYELSNLNRSIRKEILDEGEFYIVQTELDGELYLRITLMSPFSELSHLKEVVGKIRIIGRSASQIK